jgi:tripartite ATP-independent transporter DctM subunit
LATPVIILGGILGGVFTVTEAGAIACAYCALVALLVYRQLSWAEFKRSLVTAAQGTASVMIIVGASGLMGWMIADMQINKEAAALLLSVTDVDWIFLTLVNVFFLIVGMFMDPLAALIVFVPILMPAVSALGIDVVHFGVVIVINLMIGLCTPPVGYLIYLMANVAGEPPQAIIRESLPFLGVLVLVLVLVTYIPSLTLALPALILG